MPNKQDTELLECLRNSKSSHIQRAVENLIENGLEINFRRAIAIESCFVDSSLRRSSVPPASLRIATQRRSSKAAPPSSNNAVKRYIEHFEQKILREQSELNGNKSVLLRSLLSAVPRSHQRVTVSPKFAFSPKKFYHKSGWDSDDDTTVSTASISSVSMSSSVGSPSRGAICKIIENVSILDSSHSGSASISDDFSLCLCNKTSSVELEDPETVSWSYYFVFSVFLLSAKGSVDPFALCTIYLLLEIFRLSLCGK